VLAGGDEARRRVVGDDGLGAQQPEEARPTADRSGKSVHVAVTEVEEDVGEARRRRVHARRLSQQGGGVAFDARVGGQRQARGVAECDLHFMPRVAQCARHGNQRPDVPEIAAEFPGAEDAGHSPRPPLSGQGEQ
jgi:hypothetical protein